MSATSRSVPDVVNVMGQPQQNKKATQRNSHLLLTPSVIGPIFARG